MIVINEIYEAFDRVETIQVYKDNKICAYNSSRAQYKEILELWNKMLEGSHPMPAFGVSINDYTVREKESGLWIEFIFSECMKCCGMPFKKLLIAVNKDFYGFNLIRYTEEQGYYGRCFYIDLAGKNMNEIYNYMLDIEY